jgi:Niemann-Pick C1 protein
MSYFKAAARLILSHRLELVVLWVAVTLLLSFGALNVRVETDPESLWVSRQSQGFKEQQYFKEAFGAFFRTEQLMFIQKAGDANIFNKQHLYSLYLLQSLVEGRTAAREGRQVGLDQLCYKPIDGKGCIKPSPLDIWKLNLTDLYVDPDIQYTALCIESRDPLSRIPCSDQNGIPVLREVVFGGLGCGPDKPNYTIPCQHCWVESKAFGLTYLLDNDPATTDDALLWEKDVLEDTIALFNADDGRFMELYRKQFP